jgi:hypothetical protein
MHEAGTGEKDSKKKVATGRAKKRLCKTRKVPSGCVLLCGERFSALERVGALLAASFVRAAGGGSLIYCGFCSVIIANDAARRGFPLLAALILSSFSVHSEVWGRRTELVSDILPLEDTRTSVRSVHYGGSLGSFWPS